MASVVWGTVVAVPKVGEAAQFGEAPSVATYTAIALGLVVVSAVLAMLALNLVHHFRFVGEEVHMRIRRHFQVIFGSAFLLALVTPYVALNFSPMALLPFLAAAGLVVSAWAWAAGGSDGEWVVGDG